MTLSIDKRYFHELAEKDPGDVCRRTGSRYDAADRSYRLSVWNDEYAIRPHEARIDSVTRDRQSVHDYFYLFIIYYLLKSKHITAGTTWISEKDIPGGPTFFRGPHEIPTRVISTRFKNDIEAFREKCRQLKGEPVEMADAAFRFEITPRIPAAVLYWAGDSEFPPEAKILYDKTITEHLSTDIIFALAVAICSRIGAP